LGERAARIANPAPSMRGYMESPTPQSTFFEIHRRFANVDIWHNSRTQTEIEMHKVWILAGLALALATPSAARDQGISATFGNTIVTTYRDGGQVHHWFDADGQYRSFFSDGRQVTARWTIEGKKLCLSNIRPRILLSRFCTDYFEAKVGDRWSGRDPIGRRVQNTLIRGRPGLANNPG